LGGYSVNQKNWRIDGKSEELDVGFVDYSTEYLTKI
jgi:hypothetical protein